MVPPSPLLLWIKSGDFLQGTIHTAQGESLGGLESRERKVLSCSKATGGVKLAQNRTFFERGTDEERMVAVSEKQDGNCC